MVCGVVVPLYNNGFVCGNGTHEGSTPYRLSKPGGLCFRYKNLDSSCHAASRAYREVSLYKQGKAEASNNLGFCAFMRMDFEQAEKFHMDVYNLTKNELELLIADIGLMKIYQRTALNKEFYDYRNSALHRMKRIAEDDNLFVDQHEQMRLNYARSEFYIVSAVYYYYLQQRPEAVASINEVTKNKSCWQIPISCCIITTSKVLLPYARVRHRMSED